MYSTSMPGYLAVLVVHRPSGTGVVAFANSYILHGSDIETHLVMSKSAEMTMVYETKYKPKDVRALASVSHPAADIGASISSGSFPTMGMIVVPCSIRTMSEIATGVTSSLLSRAADVVTGGLDIVSLRFDHGLAWPRKRSGGRSPHCD